ncbi:MAG: TldD/PmbA family protein [Ilumatobacteraceae bacterium]
MSGASELLALAEKIVEQAGHGEQVEAYVGRSSETEIRVYEGEIENFTAAQTQGIGIRVIRDGRTGFAYAGTLEPSAIEQVLADARENAGFGSTDEWAGLAAPDGVAPPTLTLWDEALETATTERKIALAKELERLALAADGRVRVDESNYADGMSEMAVATSTGIRASGRENGCYVSVSTLADDGDETQTGFGFSVGRNLDELDLERAGREGAERATRLLGAVKPQSARLTVVLDPFVTASFLGIIGSTLNGESVAKGRSLFAHRLGEQVAAPHFTLVDDPTNPLAYSASILDGEGLAARRNVLIENGVLQRFVQSTYSGRRNGVASTGNAVRGGFRGTPGCGCLAIQVVPGERTQAEIVASIDHGVLVQSVQGLHSGVNPVSGDFSTGASGLMIRNGALAEPVREFTIASTLQRMLLDLRELGNDLDYLPMRAVGITAVVDDVSLSGA